MDVLQYKIGIVFDEKLVEKYPEIHNSRSDKNEGQCGICFCGFEEDDEEM